MKQKLCKLLNIFFSLISLCIFSVCVNAQVNNCQNCQNNATKAFKDNMSAYFHLKSSSNVNESFKSFIYNGDFEKFVKSNNLSIGLNILTLGFLNLGSHTDEAWEKFHLAIRENLITINDQFWQEISSQNPQLEIAKQYKETLLGCPCSMQGGNTIRTEVSSTTKTYTITIYYTPPNNSIADRVAVIKDISYDKAMFTIDKNYINEEIGTQGKGITLTLNKGARWTESFFRVTFKRGENEAYVKIPGKVLQASVTYKYYVGNRPIYTPINSECIFRNDGCENCHYEMFGNPVTQADYVSACHIPFKQWLEKRAGNDTYSRHLVETIKANPGGDIANVRIELTDFKDQNPDILPFTGLKINYLKDNQIIYTTGDLQQVTGSATPNQKAPTVEVHTWNRSGHTQYHISYDIVSYVPDSTDGKKTLQFDNSKNELTFEKSDQWSSAFIHLASDYKIFDINLENFETDPTYIELKNAKTLFIKRDTSVPHVTNYIILYQPENVDIDTMLM